MKKMTPKHIIIKLFKIRNEDKIFSQKKKTCCIWNSKYKDDTDVSSKTIQWKRPWRKTLNHEKKK